MFPVTGVCCVAIYLFALYIDIVRRIVVIRFLCWAPAEYKQAQKNMTCGMITCEMNNLENGVKFLSSPDVILSCWLGSKHQLTN